MGSAKDLTFNLTGVDTSASKAFKDVAATAESATGRIGGAVNQLGGIIGGEFGSVLSEAGAGMLHMGESAKGMSTALVVGGGIVAGLGTALMMMGSADKQAADQLKQSVVASGHDWADYTGQVEEVIKSQENFGHSAADSQDALRKLTQATNDPQKAIENMGVVADLAAAKHINLSDASSLLAKVLEGGGGRTLKEYGITMATTGDKTKNAQDAVDQLSQKLNGQASASMDNFGGFVSAAKAKLEDWGAKVGQVAGPILTVLGPAMMTFGTILDIVKTKQAAHAAAVIASTAADEAAAAIKTADAVATGAQAVATDGETVALGGATAAQWSLNAAMDANPVGIIAAGIGLLIGVIAAVTLSTQNATAATIDYTQALATDNGVVGEATKAQAAKAAVDGPAADAAKKLGLSLSTVTDAMIGQPEAMAEVKAATDNAAASTQKHTSAVAGNIAAARMGKTATSELGDAAKVLQGAVDGSNKSIDAAKTKTDAVSGAMGNTAGSAGTLAAGLGISIDAYNKLAGNIDGSTKAMKDWKTESDILNGNNKSLEDSVIAVNQGWLDMAAGVAASVKATDDVQGRSMDISTAEGIKNTQLVRTAITNAQAKATAIGKSEEDAGMSVAQATADMKKSLEDSKTDIKTHTDALGLNSDAVDVLFSKEMQIPSSITTDVTVNTAQAIANMASLAGAWDQLTVVVGRGGGSGGAAKHATGGTVFGAGTGLSDSVPIMASAGEEIINANAAAQWRPLLKEINAGKTPSIPSAGGGGGFHIENFITQAGQSAAEIASNLGWMSRWAT